MPNTPRERLVEVRKQARSVVKAGGAEGSLAAMIRDLCDTLLDAGLLDQAGHEGSGAEGQSSQAADDNLPHATVPHPPSPAPASLIATPAVNPMTGPGKVIEQVVDDVSLRFDLEAELAVVSEASKETIRLFQNCPAPASVEGVVTEATTSVPEPPYEPLYLWDHVVIVPFDWPLNARVLVTLLDPEGTP